MHFENQVWTRKEGAGPFNLFSGVTFPIGILLCILVNGEYFTANLFMFPSGVAHKNISIKDCFKFQSLALAGNILGALIFSWFIGYWTVNLDEEGLE